MAWSGRFAPHLPPEPSDEVQDRKAGHQQRTQGHQEQRLPAGGVTLAGRGGRGRGREEREDAHGQYPYPPGGDEAPATILSSSSLSASKVTAPLHTWARAPVWSNRIVFG